MNFLPLLFALTFCQADDLPPVCDATPVVEQEVEIISVAMWGGDCRMIFFWDSLQNEFALLSHRWMDNSYSISLQDGKWCVEWEDTGDQCYRRVFTKCYVESREQQNPFSEDQQGRPWFANLLEPGLKQPPKIEIEDAK